VWEPIGFFIVESMIFPRMCCCKKSAKVVNMFTRPEGRVEANCVFIIGGEGFPDALWRKNGATTKKKVKSKYPGTTASHVGI
jgi:hypothetical protein